VRNIGLLKNSAALRKPEEDPATKAGEYVKHLEEFPADAEARENLALLYAEHYHRPDLAEIQLEHLIQQPHAPARQIAHWLNLMADIQLKQEEGYEAARQTLERIIELFPGHILAENARHRLDHLRLQLKAKEKSQAVKLGSYEQNIGLKKR